MAKINRKNESKKAERVPAPTRVEHVYAVRRVKEFQDGHIVFDLDIDDVTVYGCRVVEGKHGDFVGWPSREGKDGRYYSHVYLALTADEQDAIIELVGKALADE